MRLASFAAAVAAALLVTAAVAALTAAAPARAPSCLRAGAKLIAADGPVRVVRIARPTTSQRTRIDSIVACWAPTGQRATIIREEDFGDDLRTSTRIEPVGGRWVGVIVHYEGGVSESRKAIVFDARRRQRVHDSRACDGERGDRSGIDDAAFLPDGGLAFSCYRLLVFADWRTGTPRELEPPGSDVRNLAVARHHEDFQARLYWTLVAGETATAKSVELGD
ncbi:MAG TPA: hypothetical protein VGV40_09990 [Solirubrobacteraceae bacterium]|nr:hypothetical protein [Solirubrobacteraceae bacterium]